MRKHRLYGVVLAMLFGTGVLTQLPTQSHYSVHSSSIRLTALRRPLARAASAADTPIGAGAQSTAGARLTHETGLPPNPKSTPKPKSTATAKAKATAKAHASATAKSRTKSSARGRGSLHSSSVPAHDPLRVSEVALYTFLVTPTTLAPVVVTTASSGPASSAPVAAPAPAPAPAPAAAPAPPPPPPPAASADSWARLRQCESNDDYADDTGNGYYGAYQFSVSTWESLGYSGLPSDAAPAVQDQAAQRLQAARGWDQWPSCSQQLGLG